MEVIDEDDDEDDMKEGMVESDDEEEREDVFVRDLKDSERAEHMVEQEGESDVVCKICGQVEAPIEVSKWSNVNSRFAWGFCNLFDCWVHLFCSGKSDVALVQKMNYFFCTVCCQIIKGE